MNFKIPLFDLNFDKQEEQAVIETLQSKWISTGPKCLEFENLFAEKFGSKHALSLTNCTVALHLALKVLGIQAGDEVIVPSLTFVATVNAVRYVNAVPVFVDITSLEDLTISPYEIEKSITNKTKAIIVMHYAGFPCNMQRIMEIAKKHNLKVIEDACHGPLSEYHGQKLGTIGDIGCFSFFSNKNLSTGEGGMLITNNSEYFEKAKLLRSHGMTTLSYERAKGHSTAYDVVELGYNYRMDDIRASIGIVQLNKLGADLEKRIKIRRKYTELLSQCENIIVPFGDNKEFVSNYIMPIVLKDSTFKNRNKFRNYLHENGIQTSVHYPAVHRLSIYKQFSNKLPITEYVANNEVTLPMYSKLKSSHLKQIYSAIIQYEK
jgi:dTDP-4-amino-4,6-dideoxygalactose transaminase